MECSVSIFVFENQDYSRICVLSAGDPDQAWNILASSEIGEDSEISINDWLENCGKHWKIRIHRSCEMVGAIINGNYESVEFSGLPNRQFLG